jgi:hypothetical protein
LRVRGSRRVQQLMWRTGDNVVPLSVDPARPSPYVVVRQHPAVAQVDGATSADRSRNDVGKPRIVGRRSGISGTGAGRNQDCRHKAGYQAHHRKR